MQSVTGRPAIYARFSSSRQDERSIEDQVRRCRNYLGDHRGEVAVFPDYAVSGSSLNRPGFEALMLAVHAGTVTSIVTEDVSRISRDFADAAMIFKQLQYLRVPLIGVADGIDTSSKHAKLTYTLKSLVADLYLDDLRDKTLRGLEGRMLAGYATGRVPFGYRTRPEIDRGGREIGKAIEVVESTAKIVVRIFKEFAKGRGLSRIALMLNREGIPSPRVGSRHRHSGWSVGTVREMLRNERYIGVWRFKTMQWVKAPGSNKRLPRKRPESEVMVNHREDLRIIDLALWQAVTVELAKPTRGRGRSRGRGLYLLSGILVCSSCGTGLTICGKAPAYYRCQGRYKGMCPNDASLRSKPLEADLFEELRRLVGKNPNLASVIAEQNKQGDALLPTLTKAKAAVAEVERRIARLVKFVTDGGDQLDSVAEKIRDLEIEARVHKAELEVVLRVQEATPPPVTATEVFTAVSRLRMAPTGEIDVARARLLRWTAGVPMTFDGATVGVELDLAALVADVANTGEPLPSYPEGPKVRLALAASVHIPRIGPRRHVPIQSYPLVNRRKRSSGGIVKPASSGSLPTPTSAPTSA